MKERGQKMEALLDGIKTPAQWKKLFDSEAFETTWCYEGNDLGAVYTPSGTRFKLWAPTAKKVVLNLYAGGEDDGQPPFQRAAMDRGEQGVFETFIGEDLDGVFYTYTVTADGRVCETADIYARACGVNGKRSMVVSLEATNPSGWEKDGFARDEKDGCIIYELHIKDFSNDTFGGFQKEWRGKYMAFTQKGTALKGHPDFKTGLEYIKALGVTHIHLLPAFDYATVDETGKSKEQFNWGYDPMNYNVPEGSYATDSYDGRTRLREFKMMVQAIHEAGLGVIMDVVYNHTYDREGSFHKTVPHYYYRADDEGHPTDGSCCGNDTASERKMFRKYMADSVCYWASEYHIDGFRFDLMGLHDTDTMNFIREELDKLPNGRGKLIYGEPWSAGETNMRAGSMAAVKDNVHLLDERVAFFNDDTRDAIKGSVFFEEEGGYVNGRPENSALMMSSVRAWCGGEGGYKPKQPGQVISYVSAHDNFTLWDKLVYTCGDGIHFTEKNETLLARNRMAAGIVFTCLGHVFIQAGEEFARTKLGIGDSYNKPAKVNQLDWNRAYEYRELTEYYKGLIALRKSFAGFKNFDERSILRIQAFEQKDEAIVSFTISESGESLFVIYNPYETKQLAAVPDGDWHMLSDGIRFFSRESAQTVEKSLCAEPLSVTILESI